MGDTVWSHLLLLRSMRHKQGTHALCHRSLQLDPRHSCYQKEYCILLQMMACRHNSKLNAATGSLMHVKQQTGPGTMHNDHEQSSANKLYIITATNNAVMLSSAHHKHSLHPVICAHVKDIHSQASDQQQHKGKSKLSSIPPYLAAGD